MSAEFFFLCTIFFKWSTRGGGNAACSNPGSQQNPARTPQNPFFKIRGFSCKNLENFLPSKKIKKIYLLNVLPFVYSTF